MKNSHTKAAGLTATQWLWIGLGAAIAAILSVLVVQAIILNAWPELVSFKPLDSYARSALFTFGSRAHPGQQQRRRLSPLDRRTGYSWGSCGGLSPRGPTAQWEVSVALPINQSPRARSAGRSRR